MFRPPSVFLSSLAGSLVAVSNSSWVCEARLAAGPGTETWRLSGPTTATFTNGTAEVTVPTYDLHKYFHPFP